MEGRTVVDYFSTDKNLRVASISIALYDYILTTPVEWNFYRSQKSFLQPNLACIMFILIRYLSILVMIVSNVGVFASSFTPGICFRYFMISPVLKVLQAMVSQVILGVRAYNISRRKRWVGSTVLALFVMITLTEFFTNLFRRIPVMNQGSCTSANSRNQLYAWLYYFLAMLYDTVTLAVSTTYLLRYSRQSNSSRSSRLIKVLLYDGLGYFAVLTASNIFNLIMYRTTPEAIQSSGTSLGFALTWIMSQRILIHLREMSVDLGRLDHLIVSQTLHAPRDINRAIRSQFEPRKDALDLEYSLRAEEDSEHDIELDVQVHVEHAMKVEYIRPRDLESGRRPKLLWNSGR